MKTISVHDLPQQLAQVIAWAMKGEEVRVLPEPLPTSQPPAPKQVDWTKSAACLRDRTGEAMLSKEDVAELFEAMRGEY